MGELNAKSTLWCSETKNRNGNILNNLLVNRDCIVINNKEFTHTNFKGITNSILDYCIISSELNDIFDSYDVLKDDDMTSYHVPLRLNLVMRI